ncbi:hypothetical protein H5410_028043 [Solanum commersonii]|uniref:Uncharacterized protein n=1 Tax=Solanum commersonii TaxID=4109 RepID=A0A9J5Z3U7_SOLCO|nr:hypothetical protein H5410_028043 [Solanum commersonii]
MNTSLLTTQNMKNLKNEKPHQLMNLGIEVTLTTTLSAFISWVKIHFQFDTIKCKKWYPFSDFIYSIIMEWVDLVVKKINVPSTLFFIQPATVFDVYYYRFTNYYGYFKNYNAKDKIIELLGLPPLSPIYFPSFVFDDVENTNWAVKSIKRQIEMLNIEENPVLVNTFEILEFDSFRILKHVTMVGIGPSIPLIFLDYDTL